MKAELDPAAVRRIVRETFEEFGARICTFGDLKETIRLDRGSGVARCYRCDGLFAMWLISAGILQFYDTEGGMLRTVRLWQERVPCRLAA
jgi:hypothetical protein